MNFISLYTMPSLEDITNEALIIENDISTEGFNLKDAIQRLKDLILRIKNFVKNIIRRAINGFKVIFHKLFGAHQQIEKIVEVVEPVDLIAIAKKVLVGDLGRTKYILNKDTSLINIDTFNKFADHAWDKLMATESKSEINELNIQSESQNMVYEVVRGEFKFSQGQVVKDENQITKITEKDLKELLSYRQIKRFSIDISEKGYPSQLTENDKALDKYLKTPNLTEEQVEYARAICDATFHLLKGRVAVAHSLLGFYRGLFSELRKGSVFNTPVPQNMKLVHLSTNGKLPDILYPRQPKSLGKFKNSYHQILPKRVSFSPNIEEAIYGIPMEVNSAPILSNGYSVLDLFVYEPIIEKDTMMVKEKYMKTNVVEWNYTHEVAITTPVKVKKTMLVRLYFNPGKSEDIISTLGGITKNWVDAFVKFELLEKY